MDHKRENVLEKEENYVLNYYITMKLFGQTKNNIFLV